MKNLLLFASGNGSNVQNIVNYFHNNDNIRVQALFCNKPTALVVDKAKNMGLPTILFNKSEFDSPSFLKQIEDFSPDLIVLAGFLWKIPAYLTQAFDSKIINIHPSLLPKYGGKGMYGAHVHQAVLDNNEPISGITIHFVNEKYDDGAIIFQAETSVADCQDAACIAAKIHDLEQKHFPEIIQNILSL